MAVLTGFYIHVANSLAGMPDMYMQLYQVGGARDRENWLVSWRLHRLKMKVQKRNSTAV